MRPLIYLFLSILLLFPARQSSGEVFTVTSFADSGDDMSPAAGSLRAAIVDANLSPEDDTIVFSPEMDGAFIEIIDNHLLISDTADDPGTMGTVETTGSLLIDASGLEFGVIISGQFGALNPVRLFRIEPGLEVEMRGLSLQDGVAQPDGNGDAGDGGGIYNEGHLVMRNCEISFCSAGNGSPGADDLDAPEDGGDGGHGGGIYSEGGGASVALYDCVLSSNQAGNGGDAGNVSAGGTGAAADGGNGGSGGAIYSDNSALRLVRTKISSNDSGIGGAGGHAADGNVGGRGGDGGNGGGIVISIPVQLEEEPSVFQPLIEDCEITDNNGFGDGGSGGAGGDDPASTADIGGPGGNGGHGGGLYVEFVASPAMDTVHVARSLFYQNRAGRGADGGDVASGTTDDGSDGGDGGSGGGIYVASAQPPGAKVQLWAMENVTVALNRSGNGGDGGQGGASAQGGAGGDAGKGGGIGFAPGGNDYEASLTHLTIYANNDLDGQPGSGGLPAGAGDGAASEGRGIWEGAPGGGTGINFDPGVILRNTIVGANSGSAVDEFNSTPATGSTSNWIGGGAQLDFLTDLGGETRVLPPLVDSPVIDGGIELVPPVTTDQRGQMRPFGLFPDIGAFEVVFQPDARIGNKSNPATHRIDNHYSASAAGQTRTLKLRGRRNGKIFFSVENDGDITESPVVRGTKPNRTIRLKAFRLTGGKTNVTAQLRSGLSLEDVEMGGAVSFQLKIKARSKKKKARQNLLYQVSSEIAAAGDAVRVKVRQRK